ncbi:MAG TPA: class 1 fructose-bisphosphatase [Gemmatimonadota bacterium]|nr:class 1 fructose-bisphosphatase [Gemmatimonadota bacterium]
MAGSGISLSRHFAMEERRGALADPALPVLVHQMAFAAKQLARELRRAALVGELGLVGERNPTGDAQKKLDVYANRVVVRAMEETDLVAAIVSEELDELRAVSCDNAADYVLCVDPLDGSSNTDVNASMGTIFSLYRRPGGGVCQDIEGELRGAAKLVAAGYVMYGPSTMLVYSEGTGVNGFTLDHDVGEFLLSHPDIRVPARGRHYSANLGNYQEWDPNIRAFADYMMGREPYEERPFALRYSGAMVADLHRVQLEGGIYFYPADKGHPNGKLRLLYECAPMAFILESAGGRASTGRRRILDITPEAIHQTAPLAIGGKELVQLYERFAVTGGP